MCVHYDKESKHFDTLNDKGNEYSDGSDTAVWLRM